MSGGHNPIVASVQALLARLDDETRTQVEAGVLELSIAAMGAPLGIEDELHVPHRMPLIPGAYNAVGAGYDAGAWAVTISGSGSGLIAMCPLDAAAAVAAAMRDVFAAGADEPECVGYALRPDREGLRREG